MLLFVGYPRCSTSRKAQKFLDDHNIEYKFRHIVDEPLSAEELAAFHKKSGLPSRRFFNTSGKRYRELGLKDRVDDMSDSERFDLLSTDGMLVKRPILVGDNFCFVGFKEDEYRTLI